MEGIDNYITVEQFARIRGVTRQAVSENIRHGRVEAKKVGGLWFINKDQVNNNTIKKVNRTTNRRLAGEE